MPTISIALGPVRAQKILHRSENVGMFRRSFEIVGQRSLALRACTGRVLVQALSQRERGFSVFLLPPGEGVRRTDEGAPSTNLPRLLRNGLHSCCKRERPAQPRHRRRKSARNRSGKRIVCQVTTLESACTTGHRRRTNAQVSRTEGRVSGDQKPALKGRLQPRTPMQGCMGWGSERARGCAMDG